LTKISVVLVVVLGLFMGVVLINVATLIPNYKTLYTNEQIKAEQANTLAMNSMLALRNGQIKLDDVSKELQSLKLTDAGTIATKDNAIRTLQTEKAELTAQASGFNDALLKLQANLAIAQAESTTKEKIITEQIARIKELVTENQEVSKVDADHVSAIGRLENVIRSNEVTIQDLKEQILHVLEAKNEAGKATGTAFGDAPKIEGQITAASGNTASINIGSAKGIKKGMKLLVYRDNKSSVQVLGYLQISDVDLSESGGVIVDRTGDVKQGDLVTTNVK
jgi:chromosome segregation ATPase